jgi:ligand-binding sensor domain-containing protein
MKFLLQFFLLFVLTNFCFGQSNADFWEIINTKNSAISHNNCASILISSTQDTMFIGTWNGLNIWDMTTNNFENVNFPEFEEGSIVNFETENGGFWFTAPNGIGFFHDSIQQSYTSQNSNLPESNYADIKISKIGDKVLGSNLNGLYILKDSQWNAYNTSNSDIHSDIIRGIAIIDENSFAYSTSYSFGIKKNNTFTFYETVDPNAILKSFQTIFFDSLRHSLWISGPVNYGFIEYNLTENTFEKFYYDNTDINSILINIFKYGPFGKLWLGTNDGLAIFDPATREVILNITDTDSPLPFPQIYDILFHPVKKEVWFATWGGGLAKWEYGKDPEFMAVMSAPEVKSPTPLLISQNANQLIIQNLAPQSIISIYNLQGKLLIREKSNNQTAKTLSPNFPSGIYLFKTTSPTGSTSQKFLFTKI